MGKKREKQLEQLCLRMYQHLDTIGAAPFYRWQMVILGVIEDPRIDVPQQPEVEHDVTLSEQEDTINKRDDQNWRVP